MTPTDKCPKCGAEYAWGDHFTCDSIKVFGPFVMSLQQSDRCRIRELEQQLAAERAKVAKLREALQDAVAGVWDGHYGRGITADYARTVDAKAREALEETK